MKNTIAGGADSRAAGTNRPPGSSSDALVSQYLALQLAGDRRGALAIVEGALAQGATISDISLGVLAGSQREIGRLWQEDRITVAQEHMATAISQLVLAHLYQRAQFAGRNGRSVLVACVPGELHDFPSRLVADALDLAGYRVHFLGADVPTEDLVDSVLQLKPDLVALSITMPFNAPGLRAVVTRMREAAMGTPIAVGGHACAISGELVQELRPEIVATDARELVESLDRRFGL